MSRRLDDALIHAVCLARSGLANAWVQGWERGIEAIQCHIGMNELGQIDQVAAGVWDGFAFEQVGAPDHLADICESEDGQFGPRLFPDIEEICLGVLGIPLVFALGTGDTCGAIGNVAAFANDATNRNHECLAEGELLGAQAGIFDDIAAILDAATHTEQHLLADTIDHQGLVRLGQAEFAWQAGVLFTGEHGRTCSAADAINFDNVGPGLGDSDRDGADVVNGDQFDADGNPGIDSLEIVNELRKILDGVNIVVGWLMRSLPGLP